MREAAARLSDWRVFEEDGGVGGSTRCGRGETGRAPFAVVATDFNAGSIVLATVRCKIGNVYRISADAKRIADGC